MKRMLGLIVVISAMVMLLVGCKDPGNTTSGENETSKGDETVNSTEDAQSKKDDEVKVPEDTLVCLSISYSNNDFMAMLMDGFETKFTDNGYKFESASADGSVQKQIEQIENFVSMGADAIIVMAVEASSLTDACQRAMDNGTKVYAFTTNTSAYSIFRGANDTIIGNTIAKLAANWIDEAFPEAEDGSVNVAIFEYIGSAEALERSEALHNVTGLTKKAKINTVVQIENTTDAGLQAAENLAQTNPETNVIICYNGGMAIGVNSYVMSPGSLFKDREYFGVFGSDKTEETIALISDSVNNEAVFRGTVLLGGDIQKTLVDVYDDIVEMLSGVEYETEHYAIPVEITATNVDDFRD